MLIEFNYLNDQYYNLFNISLTGARVQSQSQQIWMYNRYEIVMEYAKRPRLPPPFVVISYIGNTIVESILKRDVSF